MKILVVNYYYPPLVDAHAYRWAQIASYWAERGHDVEVITGKVDGVAHEAIESGVRITRVGLVSKLAKPAIDTAGPKAPANPRQRIMEFLRPLYRLLYWPDASWHWFPGVMNVLLSRKRDNYDLVVSYYPCMAGHAAVGLMKAWSRQSKFAWIADYGDPFSTSDAMQPNNFRLYRRLNRALERTILRLCSALVVTNEGTAQAYAHALGPTDKLTVIPHLVDIDRLYAGAVQARDAEPGEAIKLCFIGGFHKNIREPGRLVDLVRKLQHTPGRTVVLDIYGPLNGFQVSELSPPDCPQIRYHGPIAREEAIALLKAADVIVNVDNENCEMTPSKIVECISTGRPILNVSNPQVSYDPLREYENAGYAHSVIDRNLSDGSVIDVRNFLDRCAKAAAASRDIVNGAVGKHNLPSVALRYEQLAVTGIEKGQ